MINAWSLLAEEMDGTMDETYPIVDEITGSVDLNIQANSPYNDGWTQQGAQEQLDKLREESERKRDGRYKYLIHNLLYP